MIDRGQPSPPCGRVPAYQGPRNKRHASKVALARDRLLSASCPSHARSVAHCMRCANTVTGEMLSEAVMPVSLCLPDHDQLPTNPLQITRKRPDSSDPTPYSLYSERFDYETSTSCCRCSSLSSTSTNTDACEASLRSNRIASRSVPTVPTLVADAARSHRRIFTSEVRILCPDALLPFPTPVFPLPVCIPLSHLAYRCIPLICSLACTFRSLVGIQRRRKRALGSWTSPRVFGSWSVDAEMSNSPPEHEQASR